jgi:hypothetical protein
MLFRRLLSLFVLAVLVQTAGSAAHKPSFIVDSHIHLRANEQWVKDMVKTYRARNTIAVVLARYDDFEFVERIRKEYPDVFIPSVYINLDDPDNISQIDAAYQAGWKGVKMHISRYDYDDERYFPVYARIEKYGMLALWHTGVSARSYDGVPRITGFGKARPVHLDTICRAFPSMELQGAHFGNPWYEAAAEACRWNPNLKFDITGSTLHKMKDRLEEFSNILWWDPSLSGTHSPGGLKHAFQSLVFGTDEGPSGLEGNIERFQNLLDANKVPDNVRDDIWWRTTARRLGMEEELSKRAR